MYDPPLTGIRQNRPVSVRLCEILRDFHRISPNVPKAGLLGGGGGEYSILFS